jgi:hypothetical protein
MGIGSRDEFLKAMDDDYTPTERARNRKHAQLTDKLIRRMNRLRMQQEGSEWITKGKKTCDAVYSYICQETEWLGFLKESKSNFMGFEPAKEQEELGEAIEKRDELLYLICKIRSELDWQNKDYSFITNMLNLHPPEIIDADHIVYQKGVLKRSFSLGFDMADKWAQTFKTEE